MAVITGTSNGETLTGFSSDDTITALGGNDSVTGSGGDDTIYGGTGADTIDGGTGGDEIYGGDGADRITSGGGAASFEQLFGGDDADVFILNGDDADVMDFEETIDEANIFGAGVSGDTIDDLGDNDNLVEITDDSADYQIDPFAGGISILQIDTGRIVSFHGVNNQMFEGDLT